MLDQGYPSEIRDPRVGCLTDEDWQKLSEFAAANGRFWRKKLVDMWDGGPGDSGWVRRVRNIVGPTALAKVKPSVLCKATRSIPRSPAGG